MHNQIEYISSDVHACTPIKLNVQFKLDFNGAGHVSSNSIWLFCQPVIVIDILVLSEC